MSVDRDRPRARSPGFQPGAVRRHPGRARRSRRRSAAGAEHAAALPARQARHRRGATGTTVTDDQAPATRRLTTGGIGVAFRPAPGPRDHRLPDQEEDRRLLRQLPALPGGYGGPWHGLGVVPRADRGPRSMCPHQPAVQRGARRPGRLHLRLLDAGHGVGADACGAWTPRRSRNLLFRDFNVLDRQQGRGATDATEYYPPALAASRRHGEGSDRPGAVCGWSSATGTDPPDTHRELAARRTCAPRSTRPSGSKIDAVLSSTCSRGRRRTATSRPPSASTTPPTRCLRQRPGRSSGAGADDRRHPAKPRRRRCTFRHDDRRHGASASRI